MKELSLEEQKKYLLSKIRTYHPTFKYPGEKKPRKGDLLDRVPVLQILPTSTKNYWNIIDLIKFPEEKENWIRLSYYIYYKKPKPRWQFAGQTSITGPPQEFVKLFREASKTEWFKEVLEKI